MTSLYYGADEAIEYDARGKAAAYYTIGRMSGKFSLTTVMNSAKAGDVLALDHKDYLKLTYTDRNSDVAQWIDNGARDFLKEVKMAIIKDCISNLLLVRQPAELKCGTMYVSVTPCKDAAGMIIDYRLISSGHIDCMPMDGVANLVYVMYQTAVKRGVDTRVFLNSITYNCSKRVVKSLMSKML
jgi:hypothetical protein